MTEMWLLKLTVNETHISRLRQEGCDFLGYSTLQRRKESRHRRPTLQRPKGKTRPTGRPRMKKSRVVPNSGNQVSSRQEIAWVRAEEIVQYFQTTGFRPFSERR
jgi:hypothetical protein